MKINYQIIKQYLDSKGTTIEDISQVTDWFNQSDAEVELLEKSRQYWDGVPEDIADEKYDESIILGKIYRAIKIKESFKKSRNKTLGRIFNIVTKIAAILLIPLLVLYIAKDNHEKSSLSNITYTEIYSPLGSRTMFYLPDGSKGWLNSGSYLKFPEGFPGKTRSVNLKGEAYFEIMPDSKKPFIVSGKNLDIIARGTTFNVLALEEESEIKIALVEGAIDIYYNNNNEQKSIASLTPGQLLSYNTGTSESYVQEVDLGKYISWTKGKMVFRDDLLIDVVKYINRWYNVNIIIKDKILESYRYVATFQDETLDELLKMLTLSSPIRYKDLARQQLPDGSFKKRTIELYYYNKLKK